MKTADPERVDLLSPARYGAVGYPHDEWRRLRASAPLCPIDHPATEPYWAVTTQELIRAISTRPELFTQRPTITVRPRAATGSVEQARTIVHMDPPEHGPYRQVVVRSFTPRMIGTLESRISEIARAVLDRELGKAGAATVDFVDTIASWHPLRVISELMGIPEEDQGDLLLFTNLILASTDPEFRAGDDTARSVRAGTEGFFGYLGGLAADRRACPLDDLATVLAHAQIDGAPMPDFELISYYLAMMTAGHDTTRNALAGGLLALLEHPEQLAALRTADSTLWDTAVDEILRWTSVVIHFARTVQSDTELGGRQLAAGDRLALFYPSANRDETVYDDPDFFRIDRVPNPHLAFGYGEHYCIGQALARLEVKVLLRELLARASNIETAGPVERLSASFVGGIKHLPVRFRLD